MNPFSYGVELLALAVALYLYDASVLLFANEALLVNVGARRWQLQLPRTGFLLSGRAYCLLNPLTPQRPVFRLSFDFERLSAASEQPEWTERAAALASLRPATVGCAIGLYGLLPLALFTPLSLYALIPALLLLYGSALYGLWRLRTARSLLRMNLVRYFGFAAECLLCPPFAVNMVRRLSLAQRVIESLPSAGARLLTAADWQRLRAHCQARLDGELQVLEVGSAARERIESSKQALERMAIAP